MEIANQRELREEHFNELSKQDGKFDLTLLDLARKHLLGEANDSSAEPNKEDQESAEIEKVEEAEEEEDTGPETEVTNSRCARKAACK